MSQRTLKDLLKPPFEYISGSVRNKDNEIICEVDDYKVGHEDVGNLIAAALTEKWERDFGEPLRWRYVDDMEIQRPKCVTDLVFQEQPDWETYSYCPHCGRRLLPPEGDKND